MIASQQVQQRRNRTTKVTTRQQGGDGDVESQTELLFIQNNEAMMSHRKTVGNKSGGLLFLIVAWFGSSVICTNTSKSLGLHWTSLTFFQMIISTSCAIFGITVFHLNGNGHLQLVPSRGAMPLTMMLSLCFCAGFITLNASFVFGMHVSAVMTLRAAEPVMTWLLGLFLLPEEKTSLRVALCLLPIVAGAGLSAIAKEANVTLFGLFLVFICNICFALRTILTKLLKKKYPKLDNFNLFLQLCAMGSVFQGLLWLFYGGGDDFRGVNIALLVTNGITFYLYLQLSWLVLGMIGAVTHSVCNALRRPVICAAGWIVFGGGSLHGILGVMIATGGAILYARAKRMEGKSGSRLLAPSNNHRKLKWRGRQKVKFVV